MAKFVNGLPMGNPKYQLFPDYAQYVQAAMNNPFVLTGVDPVFPAPVPASGDPNQKTIVILQTLLASTTVVIQSIDGDPISGTIPANQQLDFYPGLRIDGGVKLAGTIILATGFYITTSRELDV